MRRALLGAAVGGWVLAMGLGFGLLFFHDSLPAAVVAPPSSWPAQTVAQRGPGYTLVMLAHPYCGCMRATLGELEVLMQRVGARVSATVLFLRPVDRAPEWSRSAGWTQASQIAGVTVLEDLGGREHKLFHASSSGEVMLYDPAGQLVFSGGITASRGHAGDNLGLRRVISLIERGTADGEAHAVFGCSLDTPEAATVGIPVAVPASLLGEGLAPRTGRALCSACHNHADT